MNNEMNQAVLHMNIPCFGAVHSCLHSGETKMELMLIPHTEDKWLML